MAFLTCVLATAVGVLKGLNEDIRLASKNANCAELQMCSNVVLNEASLCCRKIRVKDIASRNLVEGLYATASVYNRVMYEQLRVTSAPALLATSLGVIITIFLSLKGMDLPLFVYIFCQIAGTMGAILMFGQIYECVSIIRVSEGIIGGLLAPDRKYLCLMTRQTRMEIMKTAKAFRAAEFCIGGFCGASVEVIQGIGEEILNQILFLFSL